MSEAIKVPMVCVDCGGTMTDDDAIWSPGIGVLTHINYSQCIASLNERLTAATHRADAAEAERDALRKAVDAVRATRTERDAVRTVDDAMVERAARATMNRVYKDHDLFADDEELLRIHREYARIALTAAMAVHPTTGETDE